MRISLSEIWNFIDLIDKAENGWKYTLCAADVTVEQLGQTDLVNLKNDLTYDTELLPSIFTFREILWQPDVFTEAEMSLPGLRILKAFCEESAEVYAEGEGISRIYSQLIMGIAKNCDHTIKEIEEKKGEGVVTRALGELRSGSFPIIKFFIYHPQNRVDYYRDAVNRLNYAVKIMLTQFHGRYTELADPYWVVDYQQKEPRMKKEETKPLKKEPSE